MENLTCIYSKFTLLVTCYDFTHHICCTHCVRCDHIAGDILYLQSSSMKLSFYIIHTYVTHIVCVSKGAIYFSILLWQYKKAYVYNVHTCVTHIIRRWGYTCLTWNQRPVPASRGYAAQWQCNWVTDSHKSNLLRLLHKKLRCRQINSHLGTALIKRLYQLN